MQFLTFTSPLGRKHFGEVDHCDLSFLTLVDSMRISLSMSKVLGSLQLSILFSRLGVLNFYIAPHLQHVAVASTGVYHTGRLSRANPSRETEVLRNALAGIAPSNPSDNSGEHPYPVCQVGSSRQ